MPSLPLRSFLVQTLKVRVSAPPGPVLRLLPLHTRPGHIPSWDSRQKTGGYNLRVEMPKDI